MRHRISRLSQLAADDGFSIIEVLAAITLLGIVTIGVLPLFISGLRTSLSARFETQAKNLAQERIDVMRNLPFHVASFTSSAPASCWNDPTRSNPLNGATPECDYKDLLDTYYRSAVFVATSTTTGGYVPVGGSRSQDEIDAGIITPFYRYVINPVPNFQSGLFSQVVVSQFMDAARTIATPSSTYNSQNSNNDQPAAQLLGVTLITRWNVGTTSRNYVVFTQMGDAASLPTALALQAQATALRLSTSLDSSNTVSIQAEAGISRSDGSISGASSASTYAQGGFAALVPGTRVDGKYATQTAPGPAQSGGGSGSAFSMSAGSPSFAAVTLGASDITNVTAGIVADQPAVPATGTPGAGTNWSTGTLATGSTDLSFTNGPVGTLTGLPLLSGAPVIGKLSGGATAASGGTYLTSQAGAFHYAQSGAQASGLQVNLFPTALAPGGLLQVKIVSSSLVCKTTGTSTAGTTSAYNVTVSPFTGVAGVYSPPISITQIAGALPSLATSVGLGLTLGAFIKDWSVNAAVVTPSASGASVSANLNGILHITTQDTKLLDDSSAIQMDLGVLSCLAEDDR